MFFSRMMRLSVIGLLLVSPVVHAEGTVFVNKNHNAHPLNPAEQRQLNIEFQKRFGNPVANDRARSNNPWEAKKQRTESKYAVSWGKCRDYALQQRNLCYRQAKDAYNCERYYEARSRICDDNF